MWLVVYHPHQRKDGGASLPPEIKDKLFITSLENIEYSFLLETEARTMKWGWLFKTYVQWHAIAFLLSELCVRTKGEAVERAWRALEASAGRWWFPLSANPDRKGRFGCLWRPLRKLMAKARAARERELALERASANLKAQSLPFAALEQFQTPVSTTGSQASAQQLDAMLRPSAPRLGDIPSSSPTSLLPMSPVRQPLNLEAQKFQELSNMGFDWVLSDMLYNGEIASENGIPPPENGYINAVLPETVHQNSYHKSPFDGSNQSNQSSHEGSNENSNSPFRSPVTEEGPVDWANWDDMVREFGMELDPNAVIPGQTINSTGVLGLPTWF
jgi:hypothetical protein